jgi:hypothetical protein
MKRKWMSFAGVLFVLVLSIVMFLPLLQSTDTANIQSPLEYPMGYQKRQMEFQRLKRTIRKQEPDLSDHEVESKAWEKYGEIYNH